MKEKFCKLLLVPILLCLGIPVQCWANFDWMNEPHYNHKIDASVQCEIGKDGWKVVYVPLSKIRKKQRVILSGKGTLTYCYRGWSPDDKIVEVYNNFGTILWFVKDGHTLDLTDVIPPEDRNCQEKSTYGEWLSTDSLWIHSFCNPVQNWIYKIGDRNAIALDKHESKDGTKDEPLKYWEIICGQNSLYEKTFGEDETRILYLNHNGRESKVQDDDRYIVAKWNSRCDTAMVLDEAGGSWEDIYLLKPWFEENQGPKAEKIPEGLIPLIIEMEKQYSSYKWFNDCVQLWCVGAWLNDDTIIADVSGEEDKRIGKRVRIKYFKQLELEWDIRGRIRILHKEDSKFHWEGRE